MWWVTLFHSLGLHHLLQIPESSYPKEKNHIKASFFFLNSIQCCFVFVFFFLRFYLFIFREKEREGEKHWLVASCTHPNQGLNLKPGHVPWQGIIPATFCFAEQFPANGATLVRDRLHSLVEEWCGTQGLQEKRRLLRIWKVQETDYIRYLGKQRVL